MKALLALMLGVASMPLGAAEFEPAPLGTPWVAGTSDTCEGPAEARRCRGPAPPGATFRGVPVLAIERGFRASGLAATTILLDESRFEALVRALEAGWGPGEDRSEQLRAGMGATFENAVRVWQRPECVWVAEQFAGAITRSGVSCLSREAFEARETQRARDTVNGTRDL